MAYLEDVNTEDLKFTPATFTPATLKERLVMDASAHRVNMEKRTRAIDILTRHPEFEEFLELLRSGLF